MLINILYVRKLDGEITELLYLTGYPTSQGFKYFSLAQVNYGTEPTLRHKEFIGNPDGQIGENSGKLIKFDRATEAIVQKLLNSWNDQINVHGTIKAWCEKIQKLCPELVEPDIERLIECGKQSKYWD